MLPLFSAGVFHDTFTRLKRAPQVVYPSLYTKPFDKVPFQNGTTSLLEKMDSRVDDRFHLLSINRYERKKNLELALKTLGRYLKVKFLGDNIFLYIEYFNKNVFSAKLRENGTVNAQLIMAGGHDPLCVENVEHLKELKCLAEKLNLSIGGNDAEVTFKVTISQLTLDIIKAFHFNNKISIT